MSHSLASKAGMMMAGNRAHIIVLAGPTAVGKTSIALELARRMPVSIVCADSRQVFTMMDIGTAKPTYDDMAVCPHYLFNIVHPSQSYNAGLYARDVRTLVEGLTGTVLLVGGTGLYITAALDGLSPSIADAAPDIRTRVQSALQERGKDGLYQWLQELDNKAAERFADRNPRRIQRAIEYTLQTGMPYSSTWDEQGVKIDAEVTRYFVDCDREELNTRINQRCVDMWEQGLVEETERILAEGVPPNAQSLQTVGYTQALQVLGYGEPLNLQQAITNHQTATRHYAKRQRTWFRKDDRYEVLAVRDTVEVLLKNLKVPIVASLLFLASVAIAVASKADSIRHIPLSAKQLPTQYDSAQAVRNLSGSLNAIFSSKAYRNTKAGCMVWNITRNKAVYDYHADERLTPASTTKLFSTAAAFHALGADGALTTEVRATGRLLSNGTLEGDLYLVGMGDAMLTINDIEKMADELFAMGVRKILGKVYGDGSFFDNVTSRSVYSGDGEEVQATPPVRALSLNEGKLAIVVTASRNGRVSAQSIPASDAVVISIAPGTPAKRGRRRGSRFSVTSAVTADGKQHITVSGSPGANRTRTVFVTMADPALVCAGTLANRLRSGGIELLGGIGTARFSAVSRVMTKVVRPLTEFCSVVNKRSHNYFAEQVFKVVGGQYGGKTNTAQVARQAILATLDSLHIPRRGTVLNDGSGLSRRNLTCPATQVDLLRAVYKRSYGPAFITTLAIAGVDGTIRNRMRGTPAENNVHAKTGTLRNTSALSGYVTTLDGELWCFSVLSNGPYTRSYKAAENQVAAALAGFSYTGKQWIAEPGTNLSPNTNHEPAESELLDTGLAEEDEDILDSLRLTETKTNNPDKQQSKRKP